MVIKSNVFYKNLSLNFSVSNLRSILSETDHPLFIVNRETHEIFEANESVISGCGPFDPIGEKFDSVIPFKEKTTQSVLAYFNREWLKVHEEPFEWEDHTYTKIALRRNPVTPDLDTMLSVRNMIAVLANRLRSPLTGMQGYLDLIQENVEENTERMVDKVRIGLNQLMEIIDELEHLYNIDSSDFQKHAKESINPEALIREILFTYSVETRNRIKILNPEQPANIYSNPYDTKVIFKQLIDNAVEHSSGKEGNILIDLRKPNTLKVSNSGIPIPPSVRNKLYFPFVTTKSSSMGIGLTIAQLLAKWQDGIIFLSENSLDEGITFSFTLPQVAKVSHI